MVNRCARLAALTLLVVLTGSGCTRSSDPGIRLDAGARVAEDRVVNVLNWSDYIAPVTIARFEEETGIKVNYDVFDSNEVLETKLLTGHTGYDVVAPSDFFLERQAKQGIFLPLDKSKLPHYRNLDPMVLSQLQAVDPGNRFGIPYSDVVTGIGYNVAAIKKVLGDQPLDSWSMIFDPKNAEKLKACGLTMLDSEAEVFFSAKLWLGLDPASERREDLQTTENRLRAVRPSVREFHSSKYISDLANGETCVALGWSGDVLQARDRAREAGKGIEIVFLIPKEGGMVTFDMLAIPADAPHPDNAHKFIDFLMRAEVAAAFTEARKYPSGNAAAERLVSPELASDEIIFPPADVRVRLKPHRAESLMYTRYANRAWTRVRTGH